MHMPVGVMRHNKIMYNHVFAWLAFHIASGTLIRNLLEFVITPPMRVSAAGSLHAQPFAIEWH